MLKNDPKLLHRWVFHVSASDYALALPACGVLVTFCDRTFGISDEGVTALAII